jgi:CO/xanthine dehydrogenase Mo-binding subunit
MILRSPHPPARIRHIDTSKARKVLGVKAVVTGQDIPGRFVGKNFRDMPVLCWDVVRFVGDRVAAVAAETTEAADEALGLINVEYEELPAVFDPLEAMQPNAPRIHEDVASYDGAPKQRLALDVQRTYTSGLAQGQSEQGFGEADLVLETPSNLARHQGYIEPHAGTVAIDPDTDSSMDVSEKPVWHSHTGGRGWRAGGAHTRQRSERGRRVRWQRRCCGSGCLLLGAAVRAAGKDRHELHRGIDGE